jgi:hypothetical protein
MSFPTIPVTALPFVFGVCSVLRTHTQKKTARFLHPSDGDIFGFPRALLQFRAYISFFIEVTFFFLSRNQK